MARTLRRYLFIGLLLLCWTVSLAQDETKAVSFQVYPPDADVYVEETNDHKEDFLGKASGPITLSKEKHFGEDGYATFRFEAPGRKSSTLPPIAWSRFESQKPYTTDLTLALKDSAGQWERFQDLRRRYPWVNTFVGLGVLALAALAAGLLYLSKLSKKNREVSEKNRIARERGLGADSLFAGYYLKSKLGAGGGGEVYRAVRADNPDKENDVALKKLDLKFSQDKNLQDRFKREIVTASKLTHPNVIKIYDNGTEDGCVFFTMELLEGIDVENLIKNSDNGLEPQRVGDIVLEAAKGLRHAHGQGLVHRDVKGDNLFVRKNGTVVVIDFGCARKPKETFQLTKDGLLPGTKVYMPPESAKIESQEDEIRYYTQSYDQFSLAAVAFEMLTKRRPFYCSPERFAETFMLESIRFEKILSVREFRSDLSADFDRVFAKALAREPEERYSTIEEFAEDFAKVCRQPQTALAE